MKYVTSFIQVKNINDRLLSIDVNKIAVVIDDGSQVHVYVEGTPDYVSVPMRFERFETLVEEKRRALWEAKHTVDSLQIQLLAEIKDNTKPQVFDAAELVAQLKHQMFGDGSVHMPSEDKTEVTTSMPRGW